jgi:hypothetical protein
MSGWDLFYGLISPAVPAAVAAGVLCAIGWIILGHRR